MQANLVAEDAPAAEPEVDAAAAARFVEEDLECVKGLIGLQTITSLQEYDGSKQLFLFEQLTHLDRCGPWHNCILLLHMARLMLWPL